MDGFFVAKLKKLSNKITKTFNETEETEEVDTNVSDSNDEKKGKKKEERMLRKLKKKEASDLLAVTKGGVQAQKKKKVSKSREIKLTEKGEHGNINMKKICLKSNHPQRKNLKSTNSMAILESEI